MTWNPELYFPSGESNANNFHCPLIYCPPWGLNLLTSDLMLITRPQRTIKELIYTPIQIIKTRTYGNQQTKDQLMNKLRKVTMDWSYIGKVTQSCWKIGTRLESTRSKRCGRPRKTWRTVEEESMKIGKTCNEVKRLAANAAYAPLRCNSK